MRYLRNRIDVSVPVADCRPGEKGAALVVVTLMILLLLVVSGAMVMVATLSNLSTVDVVAEKQANSAAEAGMQLALNVLRGNAPGVPVNFKDAAIRVTSNAADDWSPSPRLSKWLQYTYPAAQPDRIPLSTPYDPYSGTAYSVSISAPDAVPVVVPTPNPTWIDGPVVKPSPAVKPDKPAWHPWHCAHCSWDYTHCSLYNPPNNGTLRSDGYGCRHKHCIPPAGWGQPEDGGYQRLIVRVVGYGPRGARKQLELMVKRKIFTYDAESLMYFRGSQYGGDISFSTAGTPQVVFDSGDRMIAFGITNAPDQAIIEDVINRPDKITINGKGDDYEVFDPSEIPDWLENADKARQLVSDLEYDARLRGRWFSSYPINNDGTDSLPLLTFVRGDATITSDGAGILVVTGNLNMSTDRRFKGVILLLGGGTLNIIGGKSTLEGAFVAARFGTTGGFLGPRVNITSGTTTFKHNQAMVAKVLELNVNMSVQAVREY